MSVEMKVGMAEGKAGPIIQTMKHQTSLKPTTGLGLWTEWDGV